MNTVSLMNDNSNLKLTESIMSTNRTASSNRPSRHIVRNAAIALFAFLLLTGSALAGPIIKVKIGQPHNACRGFGFCGISVEWPLTTENLATARGNFNGGKLQISFEQALAQQGSVLNIEEPMHLDAATSTAVGGNGHTLTILPGTYVVDYSKNPFGDVTVNAAQRGIIIHIETGRKSKGCTGFGICSIVIDVNSATAVEASATLANQTLHLDFAAPFGQPGQALIIDEAIRLDPATSLKFGANGVTVKPGTYIVDYSANPNGSVDLPVQTAGIVINIRFGRPSRNCRGIGICSIKIGFETATNTDRVVPTLAQLNGNTLDMQFLSTLPEQGDEFVVEEDVTVDSAIARSLGAKSLVIRKGTYQLAHDSHGGTSVQLNVQRVGIVIDVEVGRRSRNCRGFGICSVTLGLDLNISDRSAQAIATGDNGTLELDFVGSAPDHEEFLHVDGPVSLDSATATALGITTILPGDYAVDYHTNPNGVARVFVRNGEVASVNAALATSGVTVHPNPVTNTGFIGFDLPTAGVVSLWLTDMQGHTVATLANQQQMQAGAQRVEFSTGSLANGVYLFSLRTQQGVRTGRVVVAK